MAVAYTFGASASDVYTDEYGNPIEQQWLSVFLDQAATTPATGLVDLFTGQSRIDGYVVTNAQGRYGFTCSDQNAGTVVWLADEHRQWPVVALEAAAELIAAGGEASEAYRRAIVAAEEAETSAASAATTVDTGELAEQAAAEADELGEQHIALDELFATIYVPGWTNTVGELHPEVGGTGAGVNQTIFIAPFALQVSAVDLAWEYWGIEASDNTYWQFGVVRIHWQADTSERTVLADTTTRASGTGAGGGVSPRTSHRLTIDNEAVFAAGDLCLIGFVPYGNPPDMHYAVNATVAYHPV